VIRFFQPNDLAVAPADRAYDVGMVKTASDAPYFEIANLSPYVFEIQDEGGRVLAIAGAFFYTAIRLSALTQKLTLHVIATETSAPIAAASYAVYVGLTKSPPVPSAAVA
jgi:hypothetical protein